MEGEPKQELMGIEFFEQCMKNFGAESKGELFMTPVSLKEEIIK